MYIKVGDVVCLPEVKGIIKLGQTAYVKEIIEGRFVKVEVGGRLWPFLLKDVKLWAKIDNVNKYGVNMIGIK